MDLEEIRDIVRLGRVHSVNKKEMTARVKFEDNGGIISGELHILTRPSAVKVNAAQGHAHGTTVTKWTPKVKALVLCIMLPSGDGDGFIIGEVE